MTDLRRRIVPLFGGLLAANLLVWVWAVLAFRGHDLLLGSAVLAYGLGLRHAVDADHIAAIDNVSRKLMQQGRRPIAIGLFFALGHSTVVALASVAVVTAAVALDQRFAAFKALGALIGTSVSALFLFAVAAANLFILVSLCRTWVRARRGNPIETAERGPAGLLPRLAGPVFRLIGSSWQMFPLGLLFGLGFDTATEIGLLDLSARQSVAGLSLGSVMVFPALFTASMVLVDTADGILMLGAYGWALQNPMRKLRYNLTITALSVLVALAVGGVEAFGLVGDALDLDGPFWRSIGALNDHFGGIGLLIILFFAASWLGSVAVSHLKRDEGGKALGR